MKQEQPDDVAQQAQGTDYYDDLRVGDLGGRDKSTHEENAIDKGSQYLRALSTI